MCGGDVGLCPRTSFLFSDWIISPFLVPSHSSHRPVLFLPFWKMWPVQIMSQDTGQRQLPLQTLQAEEGKAQKGGPSPVAPGSWFWWHWHEPGSRGSHPLSVKPPLGEGDSGTGGCHWAHTLLPFSRSEHFTFWCRMWIWVGRAGALLMDFFLQRLWNPRSDPWKLVSLPKNHGLFRIKKNYTFQNFSLFPACHQTECSGKWTSSHLSFLADVLRYQTGTTSVNPRGWETQLQ